MAGSNFIAFRVDDDLAEAINQAVADSGMSKTEWLTEAIMIRLGTDSPEARLTTLIDQLEGVAKLITSSAHRKALPEPSGAIFPKSEGITKPSTGKARRRPSGEVSEAQNKIIELQRRFEEEGATGIDFLIAEALNELKIPTPTGTEWDNRRVMNTKVRLRKKGLL